MATVMSSSDDEMNMSDTFSQRVSSKVVPLMSMGAEEPRRNVSKSINAVPPATQYAIFFTGILFSLLSPRPLILRCHTTDQTASPIPPMTISIISTISTSVSSGALKFGSSSYGRLKPTSQNSTKTTAMMPTNTYWTREGNLLKSIFIAKLLSPNS